MDSRYYGASFYEGQMKGSLRSARATLSTLFGMYRPQSIADFGCGVGTWLRAALELGVNRILGVDGQHVDVAMLQIPPDTFVGCDLSTDRPFIPTRFDLAISLEVAEHLPSARAETFVSDLVAAADVVLFSAAVPDQGGRSHINEQFPSYWIPLFEKHSYACYDAIRPLIWSDRSIDFWYRQNLLVFSKTLVFPGKRAFPSDYDVIHPELWGSRGRIGRAVDSSVSSAKHFFSRVAPNRLVSWARRVRGHGQ